MKKITLRLIIFLTPIFVAAQSKKKSYVNTQQQTILKLNDNNYFNYQDLSGLIKNYTRGEWKQENNQLVLIEKFYSDKNINDYSIRKAPKFDYTIGKRISFFKIDGNQLILVNQEIYPEHAIFPAKLSGTLTLK